MRKRKYAPRPNRRTATVKKQYSLPPIDIERVYRYAKAHEDRFQHNNRLNESAALSHIIGVFFEQLSQKLDQPMKQKSTEKYGWVVSPNGTEEIATPGIKTVIRDTENSSTGNLATLTAQEQENESCECATVSTASPPSTI